MQESWTDKKLGFENPSVMLRAVINHFRRALRRESLETSADLYAELYSDDADLRKLTNDALAGWPE